MKYCFIWIVILRCTMPQCYFFSLQHGYVVRQDKVLILSHDFKKCYHMLSTVGQGVPWTNGYYNLVLHFSQDRTKQEPNKHVGGKYRNSIALIQRMRTKPWLSLFALCYRHLFCLCLCISCFCYDCFLAFCCYSCYHLLFYCLLCLSRQFFCPRFAAHF